MVYKRFSSEEEHVRYMVWNLKDIIISLMPEGEMYLPEEREDILKAFKEICRTCLNKDYQKSFCSLKDVSLIQELLELLDFVDESYACDFEGCKVICDIINYIFCSEHDKKIAYVYNDDAVGIELHGEIFIYKDNEKWVHLKNF